MAVADGKTMEAVGAVDPTYCVAGASVPTAVAVVDGPDGADISPRATAADGGGDLSSFRTRACIGGNVGAAGMLPAAKAGATVGGAAGGLFTIPEENAGANVAGGAELTTLDIATVGWYCGGGGSEDCTVCTTGGIV